MRKNKSVILLAVIAFYILLAQVVFAIRHPQLTDTERFLQIGNALLFRKLDTK